MYFCNIKDLVIARSSTVQRERGKKAMAPRIKWISVWRLASNRKHVNWTTTMGGAEVAPGIFCTPLAKPRACFCLVHKTH